VGILTCSLVALLVAGAPGVRDMETTLQDDAQFLHRSPAQVQRTAQQVAALGADRVRLTAGWSALAPAPFSRRTPGAPFDASDSRTYDQDRWRSLDTAVKAITAAGLGVQIDLGFWAPRWAVAAPARNGARERLYPDPHAFADFATAVARRYSGAFPDPVQRGRDLPAVRMFTTWNEPNHASFLGPQWVHDRYGTRPMSPHVYRSMHAAAYDAIKRVSERDLVLMGNTASTGSGVPGRGGVPPLEFLRTMACVGADLRPLTVPECRDFRPLRADGFAHHPYSRLTPPDAPGALPDDAPLADTAKLERLLGELAARGRIAGTLPVYLTEYGYESREDDPFQPFTRDQQARFLGWSTYLAWRDPGVRMFAQFLLRDIDPAESGRKPGTRAYYRDWQTGLFTASGEPKPAARAFKLPFFARTVGTGDTRAVLLFGQVRPGDAPREVRVERLDAATGAWAPVTSWGATCDMHEGSFMTDRAGFFLRTAPFTGAGTYRMAWHHDDGTWEPGVPVATADDGSMAPPL
jgi:hypothetical protein